MSPLKLHANNVNLKISKENCLDETIIHVDTILYLSLYYLVNDLVHLPNPHIKYLNIEVNKNKPPDVIESTILSLKPLLFHVEDTKKLQAKDKTMMEKI